MTRSVTPAPARAHARDRPAKYETGMHVRVVGEFGPSLIVARRHSRQHGWWYRLRTSYGLTVEVYEDQVLGVTDAEAWEEM